MTSDQAFKYIAYSITGGRMAHAYVVAAPPRGAGELFAKRVLSLLLCRESNPPCGHCHQCTSVEKRTHPDLHWVEPQKKSRIISVEQMRDFLKAINTTSFEAGWKGGIIVGADCLGGPSANAFLKTLEEPPPKTIFFLLTDSPQRLLPTILSRCQRISIEDPDEAVIAEEDREMLLGILGAGSDGKTVGAFGRSDRLVSFLKARNNAIEKEEKVASKSESMEIDEDTLNARIGSRYREWRHGILRAMLNWYRDILILVSGADEALVFFGDALDALRASAEKTTYRQALDQVRTVESIVVQLNRNLPESLTFENAFFKLK